MIGVLVGWQVYGNGRAVLLNYLATLLRGIRSAARKHSCNLLMACGIDHSLNPINARPAWPIDSPDIDFVPVGPWNTDGLIVINPLLTTQCIEFTNQHLLDKHPTIFIGNAPKGTSISIDNGAGIRQALIHLADHGHHRIAFIAGQPEDVDGDSRERLDAYVTAVRELGLEEDADLIAYGHHVVDRSELAMERILARNVPFTAVLGSSDECAIGAIHALQKVGKRVPQDVAVVGFDDLPEAMLQNPPLTTIHSPTFERGQRAVEILLEQLNDNVARDRQINVPTRLIVRRSCGCDHQTSLPLIGQAHHPFQERQIRPTLDEAIVEVIQGESRRLSSEDIQKLGQSLVDIFVHSLEQFDPTPFSNCIEHIMQRVVEVQGNLHCWQIAISLLSDALPLLLPRSDGDSTELLEVARAWLAQARIRISEQMQRQYQQNKLDERRQASHMGRLTAGLLAALDESEIFDVLSTHLPRVGIEHAVMALFQASESDPIGWSYLRSTAKNKPQHLRIETRQFPPPQLYNGERPFSLALLPLVDQEQLTGFVAFDTGNLALCGAILQQLVAALKTTQLYREAQEGRQLAEEANRLKSRFLSTVSHELRTPLSLIVGLSNMVLYEERNKANYPQTFRQDLERIYASAQHLDGLIRDVLDLAQSELGQLRLTWETLDFMELLQLSALVGEQLAREKGLSWQANIPKESVYVRGDRTRLQQVMLNLIHNAVKFTQQGAISLNVNADSDKLIRVSVEDSGLGISLDEQVVIFNEFRRSEAVESGGYGGLGIGLAISKRIVTLHGGEINVYSSGIKGEGSTFYFTLPRFDEGSEHAVRQSERSVLLLAENSKHSYALQNRLLDKGFAVDTVWADQYSIDAVVENAHGQEFVVIDQKILQRQNDNFWQHILNKADDTSASTLFYSFANESGHASFMEFDYLSKPMNPQDLEQILQKIDAGELPKPKTILIVDDEPAILDMHVRIVASQAEPYRILTAVNGRIALEMMREEVPDLLLLDLMMPELDGFGVIDAMRAADALRFVPVVVLTAQLLTASEMARLSQGVATVLNKGMFTIEETIGHIEDAVARNKRLGNETQRLVWQAMAYIHEQYAQPLTREDIANYVGVHHDYLTRCFSQETAVSPVTYLNRYRITQAKKLLQRSELNMTEVAIAVGFSSSSYFSRTFRREIGISPSAYKRQLKSN